MSQHKISTLPPIHSRYEIRSALSEGGMGAIYKAWDRVEEKTVILKVCTDASHEEKFLHEFEVLYHLDHPRLPQVYDLYRLPDQRVYFTMEWIEGNDAAKIMQAGKNISETFFYSVFFQLLATLQYIHRHQIVHGDVKPENILIQSDPRALSTKLIDFGLAFKLSDPLRNNPETQGTIQYAAPEIIKKEASDQRGDWYALGVILYEMACGKNPFDDANMVNVVVNQLEKKITEVATPYDFIDAPMKHIILKLLEKNPDYRYRNADEIKEDAMPLREKYKSLWESDEWVLSSCFIHREKEVEQLVGSFSSHSEKLKTVWITGEEGAGKSALLCQFKWHLERDKRFVLNLDFRPASSHANLWRFLKYLHYMSPSEDLSASFKEEIHWITGEGEAAGFDQPDPASIFARLSDYAVQAIKGQAEVIVLIDDWDSANDFEKDFFKYLFRKLNLQSNTRIFFGITALNADDPVIQSVPNSTHLPVPNFDQEQTAIFIKRLLDASEIKQEITRTVFEATRGNLLLTERTLVYLIQTGVLKWSHNEWNLLSERIISIPVSISDFVLSKIGQLSEKEKEFLQCASVFPSFFSEELKVLWKDENRFFPADTLVRAGLWARQNQQFIFSNQFLREHVYQGVQGPLKKQWHGQLAQYYEAQEPKPVWELAYHYFRSAEQDRALPYLLQCAEAQRTQFLPKESLHSLVQAVEIQRRRHEPDALSETLFKVEELLDQLGDRYEQMKTIEEILELTGKSAGKNDFIRGLLRQANYCERTSQYEASQAICETAIRVSQTEAGRFQLGQLYRQLGRSYYNRSLWDKALENYKEAYACAVQANDKKLQMEVHNSLGTAYGSQEQYDLAKKEFEQCAALAHELQNHERTINSIFNIARIAYKLNDLETAMGSYEKAYPLIQKSKNKKLELEYYQYMGFVYFEMHHFESALECSSKVHALSLELDDRMSFERALAIQARTYARLGLDKKAKALIEQAIDLAIQLDNKKDLSINRLYHVEILLAEKSYQNTVRWVEESMDYFTKIKNSELLFFAGQMLMRIAAESNFERMSAAELEGKLGPIRSIAGKDGISAFTSLKILTTMLASRIMRLQGDLIHALEHSTAAVRLLEKERYYEFSEEEVYYNHYLISLGSNGSRFEIGRYLEKAYQKIKETEQALKRSDFKTSYLQIPLHQEIVSEYKHFFSEERESDIQSFQILYEMSKDINSILESERLFQRIMDNAIENTKADRGLIILISENDPAFEIKVARNVEQESLSDLTNISRSIVEEVYQTGQSLVTADANLDGRFKDRKSIVAYNIRSIMCVPLRIKDQIIGAVYVDKRFDTHYFSSQNIKFLESFANLAGVAIENARLYEKLNLEKEYLAKENVDLKSEIQEKFLKYNIVGRSKPLRQVFHLIENAADNTAGVLIQGESGTGKELVAKAIHYNGLRKNNKFVAVDCGALPENLLESELFGYKKGAFTGAASDKKGLFEEADGGTIFLDEITNTSLNFQARFLRVIQEGEIRRVGDNATRKIDVRIIAATNRNLLEQVKAGLFREDLYYRLNVIPVFLPPLRERREDIPLLVQFLIDKHNKLNGKSVQSVSAELMQRLMENNWNGNIRELENGIHRMILFSKSDHLGLQDLPDEFKTSYESEKDGLKEMAAGGQTSEKTLGEFESELATLEKEYFIGVLTRAEGNKTKAAEMLGIKRTTLNDRLKKFGL